MLIEGSTTVRPSRRFTESESNTKPSPAVALTSGATLPTAARHLPQMLLATTVVVILPLAASLTLRASGLISSPWLSVALTVGLSLAASTAGSAFWRKRVDAGELVFSELLVWGWVRRLRQERELANAGKLLALAIAPGAPHDEDLTTARGEALLLQLARALEGPDVYLNGHSRRVARHATMIARELGLPSDQVARIRAAAAIHDVGKLLTPKAILNKPGGLTDAEFDVIKRHPVDGAEMVAALGDHELTQIVRHHHERLDGAGYPDRLAGEQIPLGARIIAVADTFDAITSARAYRPAARHQKAIDILRAEAGSQLDPEAVRAFIAYYDGTRPTAAWALVTAGARHVLSWLSGDAAAAATISAGKVAATTAATVAIGAVAAGAPIPAVHASHAHAVARAVARAAAPARLGTASTAVRGPAVAAAPATVTSKPAAPGAIHRARRRGHGAIAHATTARTAPHTARSGDHPSTATKHPPAVAPSAGSSHTTAPAPVDITPAETTAPTQTTTPAQTTTPTQTAIPNTSTAAQHPQTTPPGHAKNETGNGNAYGHDNTHGNAGGNGQGNGNSNQDSQGNGSTAEPTTAPTTTTTLPQTTTSTQTENTTPTSTTAVQSTGNDNGKGNDGSDNGKAKGKAGDAGPPAPALAAP